MTHLQHSLRCEYKYEWTSASIARACIRVYEREPASPTPDGRPARVRSSCWAKNAYAARLNSSQEILPSASGTRDETILPTSASSSTSAFTEERASPAPIHTEVDTGKEARDDRARTGGYGCGLSFSSSGWRGQNDAMGTRDGGGGNTTRRRRLTNLQQLVFKERL